jgi:hypothetical protein
MRQKIRPSRQNKCLTRPDDGTRRLEMSTKHFRQIPPKNKMAKYGKKSWKNDLHTGYIIKTLRYFNALIKPKK